MSSTITVRSLPGFTGVALAASLLLAGADARRAAVEIVVERRAGALAWLVFRLALGPTLLLLALVGIGMALGIALAQHGVPAL